MEEKNLDKLQLQIKKLLVDCEELKNEFDNLLKSDVSKTKPRIIGAITSAGGTLEKLLTYIIISKGKEKKLLGEDGKHVGLNQLKNIAQEYIPKEQFIHINSIMHWRNHVAHGNDIDKVKKHELSAVNSALDSFVDWFFKDFLKAEFPDFSKSVYSKNEKQKEPTKEELDEIKKNFEKNPFNIPDFSILTKSKKFQKRKRRKGWLILLIFMAGISYAIYHFYIENPSSKTVIVQVKPKANMNKDQVYDFLISYFNNSNSINSDAYEYFANYVDTFYFQYHLNPTEINIIRRLNTDYIDNKSSIDKESLYPYSKNNSIVHWRFWTEYTCYRPSLKKFQNSKVQLDFGINNENKITCIKQVNKTPEKYTKEKPI